MAKIEFSGGLTPNGNPVDVTVKVGPSFLCCPKCGAEEGQPHQQCSSPYLTYSSSKTRTMTKNNTRPLINK